MTDKSPVIIGLPMLVVVFMGICLFSFSGIAYSTARSSLRISETMAQRAQDYQSACNEAERTLAALEKVPKEECTYQFPFGVNMENLVVTIIPDELEESYRITKWQVNETASWEAPEAEEDSGPQGPMGPEEP